MKLGELYDRAIMALSEDWDKPVYWKQYEIFTYIKDGINDTIEKSNIVLNERSLNIVPRIDNRELVAGWFSIPSTISQGCFDIHSIKSVYWRDKSSDNGEFRDIKLKVAMPYEMDYINNNWRNEVCKAGMHPTHAIMYGGDVADFGDSSSSVMDGYATSAFSKPKIRLYPIPEIPDGIEEIINALKDNIFEDFNNSGGPIDLGIVSDDENDMLNNLANEDGTIIGSNRGQAETSYIIKYEEELMSKMAGVLPFVLYKPKFSLTYTTNVELWRDVDLSFLSDKDIINIVNYVEFRAYRKAGDTQDINISSLKYQEYNMSIVDANAKSKVYQTTKLKRDRQFI